jgi:NAD(P)-dependent dehydrogenase (short-subunit alcohol dehydrogenase family)
MNLSVQQGRSPIRHEPLRDDYRDEGSSSLLSRSKGRPFRSVFLDRRKDRASGRGPYSAAKWGVEGFSEVLSREVAPLGIRVTIVEPGGFRTDFAGISTKLSEGRSEYDSTVGATARFQRDYNGKQPGDPKKAAQAIVRLTQEQKPPLRLLLGSDAYDAAEKNDLARLEEAENVERTQPVH